MSLKVVLQSCDIAKAKPTFSDIFMPESGGKKSLKGIPLATHILDRKRGENMDFGYVRVSTKEQNPDRQIKSC